MVCRFLTDKPVSGGFGAASALNKIASILMPSYQDQKFTHVTAPFLTQQGAQPPLYLRQYWLLEYANGDTFLPYWKWVEMVRGQGLRSSQHTCRKTDTGTS